jgi:hypothetical protein
LEVYKNQITMLSYRRLIVNIERDEFAAGSTLPLDQNAYRMAVAHALLKRGTPFSILDNGSEVRDFSEDLHYGCSKQGCSDYTPVLNKKELDKTIEEMNEAKVFSICSDGTINVAEVLVW